MKLPGEPSGVKRRFYHREAVVKRLFKTKNGNCRIDATENLRLITCRGEIGLNDGQTIGSPTFVGILKLSSKIFLSSRRYAFESASAPPSSPRCAPEPGSMPLCPLNQIQEKINPGSRLRGIPGRRGRGLPTHAVTILAPAPNNCLTIVGQRLTIV